LSDTVENLQTPIHAADQPDIPVTRAQELRALLKMAGPLVLAQLASNTLSLIDTLMVGQLGKEAIAGIALGSAVFLFVYMVLMGVVLAVGPIVSQATGAGDQGTAARVTRQGLWLSVLLFIPAFVLYWNAYPLMIWMRQSEATAAASSGYLQAISWGLLPALWTVALRGLLEGVGNTRPIMVISFIGVGLNVFFNNVLMFGWYGLPALGLVGTGYASSVVYTCVFLLVAVYVHLRYRDYHVFSRIRTPDATMLWQLVRIGFPIGLTLGFEGGLFSAAAIAMGTLGTDSLAGHQIALQTASISFMVPLGIAIAVSVRVGQAVGRKSMRDAETAGHVGMFVCTGVMCSTAVLYWLAPEWIVSLYIDISDAGNRDVVRFAAGFLSIAAVFQIFDGLQVSASFCLRGLKDTTAAMILCLVSYWGVGAVAGYVLCFVFDFGGNGLWVGMTLGLATAALLLSTRFQWKVRRLD
jgi:MATE family multidrug resistance protein